MMSGLQSSLAKAGYPLIEVEGTGSSVLILPHGGRIISLAPDGRNLLWVPEELSDPVKAAARLGGDEWPNPGGDRIWMSPEAELCISDLSNAWATYVIPPAMDPGEHEATVDGNCVLLRNRARLAMHQTHAEVDTEIRRVIRAAPNPLRRERDAVDLLAATSYAGYEQATHLELLSSTDPRAAIDLWSLTMVPSGGDVLIPTTRRSEPLHFFGGRVGPGVQTTDDCITFTINAREQDKIGVRAADLIGRIGYLRPLGDGTESLIVRNFVVDPSGEYVDMPWEDVDDRGYCVQCYNDDGSMADFGEMEYHTPGVGGDTGRTEYTDVSQMWAYVGPPDAVRGIARWLLGVAV